MFQRAAENYCLLKSAPRNVVQQYTRKSTCERLYNYLGIRTKLGNHVTVITQFSLDTMVETQGDDAEVGSSFYRARCYRPRIRKYTLVDNTLRRSCGTRQQHNVCVTACETAMYDMLMLHRGASGITWLTK